MSADLLPWIPVVISALGAAAVYGATRAQVSTLADLLRSVSSGVDEVKALVTSQDKAGALLAREVAENVKDTATNVADLRALHVEVAAVRDRMTSLAATVEEVSRTAHGNTAAIHKINTDAFENVSKILAGTVGRDGGR